jgi:hypothetical protein
MKNILIFCFSLVFFMPSTFCREKIDTNVNIDVVYTWVDGSEEKWKKTLSNFMNTREIQSHTGADALLNKRFRNHNELKYSLRSIQAHAPWVHHIYIVTCGQKPKWFKDHPKITFVNHSSIFKNGEDLPTYNSMAIESNLHRIPGLSDYYIYLNDDVFLGRLTKPTDFFTKEGKIRVFLSKKALNGEAPLITQTAYWAASQNTLALMNSLYQKKSRCQHAHTPFPSSKSIVQKIEELHPDIFALVSSHHFRSLHDYTITNGLIPYVALEERWAKVSQTSSLLVHICQGLKEDIKELSKIQSTRPKFFCLQDGGNEQIPEVEEQLETFFNGYFPTKAAWETNEPIAPDSVSLPVSSRNCMTN